MPPKNNRGGNNPGGYSSDRGRGPPGNAWGRGRSGSSASSTSSGVTSPPQARAQSTSSLCSDVESLNMGGSQQDFCQQRGKEAKFSIPDASRVSGWTANTNKTETPSADKIAPPAEEDQLITWTAKAPTAAAIKCEVAANHFAVSKVSDMAQFRNMLILQYDVDITKIVRGKDGNEKLAKLPKALKNDVMNLVARNCWGGRYPAFDGNKILYSNETPLFSGETFERVIDRYLRINGEEISVYVTVSRVGDVLRVQDIADYASKVVKTQPRAVMQALDVILRQAGMNSTRFSRTAGRYFFSSAAQDSEFDSAVEICAGIFQGVSLGQCTQRVDFPIYLNVDSKLEFYASWRRQRPTPGKNPRKAFYVNASKRGILAGDEKISYKAFPNSKAKKVVNLNIRGQELLNFVRDTTLIYESPVDSTRKIITVTNIADTPSRQRFTPEGEDTPITVSEYFQRKPEVRDETKNELRMSEKPCLEFKRRSDNKTLYYPMEFCELAPQKMQMPLRNLSPRVIEAMTKKAAGLVPNERKRGIENQVDNLKLNSNPSMLHEFKLGVELQMTTLLSQVLSAPELALKMEDRDRRGIRDQKMLPKSGKWLLTRGTKLHTPASNLKIKIILISLEARGDSILDDAKRNLEYFSRSLGVGLARVETQHVCAPMSNLPLSLARLPINDASVVVAIIPNDEVYAKVKKHLEMERKVLTQCVKFSNCASGRNDSLYINLILKINMKVGATNHTLACPPRNKLNSTSHIVVMGADVTHPPPGSQSHPSVAAVTANFDAEMVKYNMEWRMQLPNEEIIYDLKDITAALLSAYKKKMNYPPWQIIFYRDGVSDSQFPMVLKAELNAIKAGCTKAGGENYKPKITFIVVQKRNHSRFFATGDSSNRVFNVPAGCVVDTTITHPWQRDFFLISHGSPLGTARPTRYRVLVDENEFPDVGLKNFTYGLCHLYSKCTMSVSYPAPTYYAHLAAARAKLFCVNLNFQPNTAESEKRRAYNTRSLEISRQMAQLVNKNPMFYI